MTDKIFVTVVTSSGEIKESTHFTQIKKDDRWTDPFDGKCYIAMEDYNFVSGGLKCKETAVNA